MILALFVALLPIYIWPSGGFQPSTLFFSLVFVLNIRHSHFKIKANKALLAFIFYTILVNILMTIFAVDANSKGLSWIMVSSFYIYNALVFFIFRSSLRHIESKKLKRIGLLLISLVPLMFLFSDFSQGSRQTLSFNNPNQLGHFSVCLMVGSAHFFRRATGLSKSLFLVSMILALMITYLSLSKAAIIVNFVIFAYILFSSNSKNFFKIIVVILLIMPFGLSLVKDGVFERFKSSADKQQGVSELEYRGYDRMYNHPEYMFFGAGEGAYDRFDTFIENHELHSTLGTLIFCYGLPGLSLFIRFIKKLVSGIDRSDLFMILMLFTFGLTHNGLRFTPFWICLALLTRKNSA